MNLLWAQALTNIQLNSILFVTMLIPNPFAKKIDSNSFAGKYLVKHNTEKVENNSRRCSIVMLSTAVRTCSWKYVFLKMFHNLQENTYVWVY